MSLFWRAQLACLFVSLSTINFSAVAQQESQTSQPPPQLERLEYFEGEWRCQQPAAPKTPDGVFIWTVQPDLNNFWYVGNAEEIELPDEKKPINSREFLGYDAILQKLFRFVIVGNGNSFNFTALDWQDKTLVWEGSVVEKGKVRPLRQEIVQDSKDKFTATYLISDEEGDWQPVVDETCNRIS